MKRHLRMWLVAMLFFPLCSIAQNATSTINSVLHGRVTDAKNGTPLEGANVSIKNTTHSVITDRAGKFTFRTGQTLPYILVVSFVGYKPVTLTVSTEDIEVKLEEQQITQLDDVVVTGVAEGTSRKKLSFALTKVNAEQLNTVPASDASLSLRGKVAGLQIDQSAGNQGATVYLRGAKSINGNIAPLLVIDGFFTALSLSDLNPQDIESIEVVKGAAASALYGTRGEGVLYR